MKRIVIPAIFSLFVLTACQGTKETLGIGTRQVPDEFAVVKNAPLTLPPDYELRPPRPGAPRPQARKPEQDAKEAITGKQAKNGSVQKSDLTRGESSLLTKAGAEKADPDIREDIDRYQRQTNEKDIPVTQRLFGRGDKETPATIVDAKKERERIRENLEQGESVTQGETPSIED